MRPHLLLPGFLLIALSTSAVEKPVPSKITETRVFLSGAQIMRNASASVPAGISTLIFTGLAQDLDPQSIQVTGKGGYTILSVEHRIDHLTESPKKKEIEDLDRQVKDLERELNSEKALQQVWEQEEQLLLKNTSIAGQQNGVTQAQLQAVNDYVRERLKAVKAGWLLQQEKINKINEELAKLRQQQQQFQIEAPRPTSEILVEISSPAEVNATFTISYFASNAGWSPAYDLRAMGVGKPIELLMKAQVVNNTGEDWDKVKMSLSSGNPTLGGTMPALQAWYLQPTYRPVQLQSFSPRKARSVQSAPESDMGESLKYEDQDANVTVNNQVSYRTTTMEFVIETPFTVPSDGRPHMIGVKSHEVPATYQYYVTPKLDRDAFLYARTTGWEDLNLLPGAANIFFEGTFVGETHLQLDVPADTLEISLGRDKGIVVDRVKRKMTNDKSIVGSKRTMNIGWDITVRNTKSTAIDIEVRDQYPLSPQSEIEVKLEEDGDAIVDEQTGILKWKFHLEPKGSKKLGYSYSVKYPKDMPVVVE